MSSEPEVPAVVSASWLRGRIRPESPSSLERRVRIVDVRWSLASSGRAAHDAGHVPGAVFLDLDTDLSAPQGPGRHPIPDLTQLARVLAAIGVDETTHVVAYDDAGGAVAARVWFLLHHYGHPLVSILDGGYRGWLAEGGEETQEPAVVTPVPIASVGLRPPIPAESRVVDKDAVRALGERNDVVLIDVRAPERYRGESEPIDARAGHIPGAKNVPWSSHLRAGADGVGRLLPVAELRDLYARVGAEDKEVVVYCGSGVTACLGLLALDLSGLGGARARVYEGSWSDWARDTSLPAARS